MAENANAAGKGISRRELFRLAGAAGAGAALGASGAALAARKTDASDGALSGSVEFHGAHQAGIATPQQENLHFAAFDLTTEDPEGVRDLLKRWSEAAALMTRGEPVGETAGSAYLPPEDTGEAIGLAPARLTVTFGFGPSLFERDGKDRFGLADKKPEVLREIPSLPGDNLDPQKSGGDLCVQACSDDQQVAFHAVRNLARIARGDAVVRWSQLGFGRTASTSTKQETPRNLMGLKDGTSNIKAEDEDAMERYVWAGQESGWMEGGTYLVARRIRMFIEVWDRVSLDDQEKTIGRHKVSGAPLGKEDEFDEVDLEAKGEDGYPVIPANSHVRLAREDTSERILRRGYSFTDGMDFERGQLDAGLFFICFQRDPHEQFVPLQQRLGQNDALNEYIQHTSSALFACPPGWQEGGFAGETLFA